MKNEKLKSMRKTSTSSTVSSEIKKESKPPKGAEIIERTVKTETEEIENGYLITKSISGRYRPKDSPEDSYGNYFDYRKRWYSKEDPLTINLTDKSLAEAFEEEDAE